MQLFRDPKQQEVLAVLAKSKLIHFVVSVDHINANLLWDEVMSLPTPLPTGNIRDLDSSRRIQMACDAHSDVPMLQA
jgi:hypothetical protein